MISFDEYIRKIIHLFSLIIPFGYLFIITDKYVMVLILIVLNIIFLFFDIARHRIVWIQSIFKYFFNDMLRGHELKGHLTGATWVLIGSLISILIFIYCLGIILKQSNDLFLKSVLIIFSLCFILGIDHARFLSIFFFNLTMIYLIKLKRNEIYFQLPKFKNYFWLIVFMGPWGVNICLPILTILKKAIFYGTLTFN